MVEERLWESLFIFFVYLHPSLSEVIQLQIALCKLVLSHRNPQLCNTAYCCHEDLASGSIVCPVTILCIERIQHFDVVHGKPQIVGRILGTELFTRKIELDCKRKWDQLFLISLKCLFHSPGVSCQLFLVHSFVRSSGIVSSINHS